MTVMWQVVDEIMCGACSSRCIKRNYYLRDNEHLNRLRSHLKSYFLYAMVVDLCVLVLVTLKLTISLNILTVILLYRYACLHVYVFMYMRVYMYVNVRVCLCVCIYVCINQMFDVKSDV